MFIKLFSLYYDLIAGQSHSIGFVNALSLDYVLIH